MSSSQRRSLLVGPQGLLGQNYARLGLAMVAMVLTALVLTALTPARFSDSVAWVALMGSLSVPLWLNQSLRTNPFHPFSFWALKTAVFVPLGGLALLLTQPWSGIPFDHFAEACLLVTIFYLGVYLGFRSRAGRGLARAIPLLAFPGSRRRSKRRLFVTAVILYLLGWAGRVGLAQLGVSHLPRDLGGGFVFVSALAPLRYFAVLASVVIVWELLQRQRSGALGREVWLVVSLVIGLEVLAGAIEGGRSNILMPLVIGLIVVHYGWKTISWRVVAGLLLLVVFFAIPLLTAYRALYFDVLQEQGPGPAAVQSAVERLENPEAVARLVSTDALIGRFGIGFEGPLQVYAQVPERHPYQMGDTFWPEMVTNFVPRIVWPEKPVALPGRQFAETFWEVEVGDKFGTSMGIRVPGELYYNFGWLGLCIAPLWGFGIRFFWERARGCGKIERYSIVRLLFAILVVTGFGHMATTLSGILRQGLWYLVFLMLLYWEVPRIITRWSR